MLYREPKVLKHETIHVGDVIDVVSVLYREPKVLKPVSLAPDDIQQILFQCSTVSRKY